MPAIVRGPESAECDIVVITASLGGLRAIEAVLSGLPASFAAPVVIVQHLSQHHPTVFADLLAPRIPLAARWVRDRECLAGGTAYVAPPGHHVVIDENRRARLVDDAPVNHARPSADLLFMSVAAQFTSRAVAVVLTGRLCDGAAGALAVREAGGVVIAQDPQTCAAPGMPSAAIAAGAAHFVLPPNAIGEALVALTMVPGGLAMFGWSNVA